MVEVEAEALAPLRFGDELQSLRDQVPDAGCKGLCQESCGPILWYRAENEAIIRASGPIRAGRADLTCPYLSSEGQCEIYQVRPMICRLWGSVKAMRCPHGCRPKRWLTNKEAYSLLDEADRL